VGGWNSAIFDTFFMTRGYDTKRVLNTMSTRHKVVSVSLLTPAISADKFVALHWLLPIAVGQIAMHVPFTYLQKHIANLD
jgi:hypothetical protein